MMQWWLWRWYKHNKDSNAEHYGNDNNNGDDDNNGNQVIVDVGIEM